MFDLKIAKNYLSFIENLKTSYNFYDMHVHPFEVITNQYGYTPNKNYRGLFSRGNARYIPPRFENIGVYNKIGEKEGQDIPQRIKFLFIRNLYTHTGPRVFRDHMRLSGIKKVLLLPVAPVVGDMDSQMTEISSMFGGQERFLMGCSIPNTIENKDIERFAIRMIHQFDAKAIKLHPNVSEIDLGSQSGIRRVESILDACEGSGMPLVVHGGRSPVLKNPNASAYARIENLKNINWGISKKIVVIAHAGSYSCSLTEIEKDVIPRLNTMLSKYENIMIDISALEIDAVVAVFRNIDPQRILFGSDALYEPQWTSVVKVLCALSESGLKMEKTFIQIASTNPSKFLFDRTEKYACAN